jgi:hypothetical protein
VQGKRQTKRRSRFVRQGTDTFVRRAAWPNTLRASHTALPVHPISVRGARSPRPCSSPNRTDLCLAARVKGGFSLQIDWFLQSFNENWRNRLRFFCFYQIIISQQYHFGDTPTIFSAFDKVPASNYHAIIPSDKLPVFMPSDRLFVTICNRRLYSLFFLTKGLLWNHRLRLLLV